MVVVVVGGRTLGRVLASSSWEGRGRRLLAFPPGLWLRSESTEAKRPFLCLAFYDNEVGWSWDGGR